MGRSFESLRQGAQQVSASLAKAGRAMKEVDVDRAQPRKLVGNASDPRVIAKSGRRKALRIILAENAEAVIERKLGWIK